MSLFPNSLKYDDEVLTLTKAYAQSVYMKKKIHFSL